MQGPGGRKSAAALALVTPMGAPVERLAAVDELTQQQADRWNAIVNSKAADHFTEADAPVLAEYVRAVDMAARLSERLELAMENGDDVADIDKLLAMRDRESKRLMAAATKLRLTQQSRYTPQAAGTAARRPSGRKPWQPASQ